MKKPIYKRWWFILLVIFVFLAYLGSSTSESSSSSSKDRSTTVRSESTSVVSSTTTSDTTKEDKEIKKFLKHHDVSEEFVRNLIEVLPKAGLSDYSIGDINSFEQTDNWAEGHRYNAQVDGKIFLTIDTIGDEIYCIRDMTGNDPDNFIYRNEDARPVLEQPDDGSILLVANELGNYGKEVTIPSKTYGSYTYIEYMVPAGDYIVENMVYNQMAVVFVINNNDSNDVKSTVRFSKEGETQTVTVNDGYHIQLSDSTQVKLTPVK